MQNSFGLVAPCAVILLTACSQKQTSEFFNPNSSAVGALTDPAKYTKPEIIPGLPKGYRCPLIPNGFDPAGSIYRIDRSGTYYRVKDFGSDPNVQKGRKSDIHIANYVLSDEQISSTGLSANLLSKALPGLSASAYGNANSKISLGITVKDLRGEVIYDEAADYAMKWFRENITPRAGNRYYLVRETIKAGAVSYRLKEKDAAKFGGKAEMIKLANAKGDVTVRDNAGSLEVEQTFEKRISVCTKPAEIAVDHVRTANVVDAVKVTLKSTDDSKVRSIKRVGQK
ncbi:MAG: hypothetical protein ACR2PA_05235 [Hyphomicrobiaceae bacterium]